ncbi:hypothetical protein [Nitrosarchaeum sp.]|nr:hypothetical protein [Nitrosarchaeum sp.]MCV0412770.1 hypothetical protein [Nitrosarchaeum sp.]
MVKRITVMIDDDVDKKLRAKQVKIMQKTTSSCSYSKVINDTLKQALS